MLIAKPIPTVGTQWRRVPRGEDTMLRAVDELSFVLGIAAPQHKDHVFALTRYGFDNGVSKLLPTFPLVAACLTCSYGKRGIEQEYTLFSPTRLSCH